MKKTAPPPADGKLVSALEKVQTSLEKLPREFEYVIHPGKHLILTYVRGIVYGLGALTAVAIVIPLIIAMLNRISWVPILGDLVNQIAERMEQQR